MGGQQSRPGELVSPLAVLLRQRPGQHPGGVFGLAAGQHEQRRPRLGVEPVFVRLVELLLGTRQIPHPEPDLPNLVVGGADTVEDPIALQLLAGIERLGLCLPPGALETLELGAMDLADTRVPADRLPTHPTVGLFGPLCRPPEVGEAPTGGDGDAVHVAG